VAALPAPVGEAVAWRSLASTGEGKAWTLTAAFREFSDGRQYFPAVPEQDADVLELLIGKMGKDRDVDAVLRKCAGVLGQAEPCEPIGYFLHRRPRPADFRPCEPAGRAILPDRSFGAKSNKTDFRGQVLEDPAAARGDRGSGNPEAADEDPPCAAGAAGLFISDTSTALADLQPNDQ
jgi:hypothetical protein